MANLARKWHQFLQANFKYVKLRIRILYVYFCGLMTLGMKVEILQADLNFCEIATRSFIEVRKPAGTTLGVGESIPQGSAIKDKKVVTAVLEFRLVQCYHFYSIYFHRDSKQ